MRQPTDNIKQPTHLLCILAMLAAFMPFMEGRAQTWKVGDIWPEDPKVAKLRRVTMSPPALSTGAVTFQVPLYEIKVEDLSLPIELRYHSNGIQVDEDPYPVGYGWALVPAMRITRQILGRADGHGFGFIGDREPSTLTHAELQRCMVERIQLASPGLDSEKDLFTVFMPEGTFTGVYEDGGIILPGHTEYKVTCSEKMQSLEVTDPKGRVWTFDRQGARHRTEEPVEWCVSGILFPSGKEVKVDWEFGYHLNASAYHPYSMYYPSYATGWTPYIEDPNAGSGASIEGPHSDKSLNPVRITFPGGKVEFTYNGGSVLTTLKEIKVTADDGTAVERINLAYGTTHEDRTMLESVTYMDGSMYSFGYNPERFLSPYQTDYWGYYNRGGTALTEAPPMTVWLPAPTTTYASVPGSNRQPNETYMKARILTSVTYPTGGVCEWEYEPHRFVPVDFADHYRIKAPGQRLEFGGGLRVTRQTLRKTTQDTEPYVVEYIYGENGDGKAVVEGYPTASTFLSSCRSVTNSKIDPHFDPEDPYRFGWDGPILYGVVTASPWSSWRDSRYGEEMIWYSRVEEVHPEGKVVHLFDKWARNDVAAGMEGVRPFSVETAFGAGVFETERTEYEGVPGDYTAVRKSEWEYGMWRAGVARYNCIRIKRSMTQGCVSPSPDFPEQKSVLLGDCEFSYDEQTVYTPLQYSVEPYVMTLSGVIETEYTSNGPMERTTVYDYRDDTGILTAETLSDGANSVKKEYLYPFNTPASSVNTAMLSANQQGIQVGERVTYGSAVSQHLMEYARIGTGSLYRPIREKASRGNAVPWTVATYEWNTDGTLKSRTGADGIKVSYTWDTAGLYPLSMTTAGRLQKKLTWKPLVGVASMTDEAGLVTSFTYDSGRRLKEIRKGGRLLERYEYAVSQSGENSVTTRTHTSASASHMTRSRVDGLGREWSVFTELPGGGTVTLTEYDAMGRQSRSWFPAPGTSSMTESQIRSSAISFHSDNAPWEGRTYRRSPSEDLLTVMRGGEAWLDGGHVSHREVTANGVPERSHLMLGVMADGVAITGMTPAGRLRYETVTDEDGLNTETLTDLRGLKLSETRNSRGVSYVYDGFGDLRYVLPSGAPSVGTRTDREFEATVYWYDYDARGRMTLSHIPGTRAARYVYDPADRLVAEQSSDHPAGVWRVYAYDDCGRKVVAADCDLTDAQAAAFGSVCRTATMQSSGSWGGYVLNPAPAFSPDESDITGVWFYDYYTFIISLSVGYDFLFKNPATIPGFTARLPQGMSAASSGSSAVGKLTGCCTGKGWEVYYYDRMGQVCQTVSTGYNRGRTVHTYNYDLSPASEHAIYGGAFPDTDTYHSYDAVGRPTETMQIQRRTEDGIERCDTAVFRTVYDAIGRVVKTQSGPLTTTHTYDVHGWLKTSSTQGYGTYPYYSQKLMYADGATPLWNGRISGKEWSTGTSPTQRYDYTYDARGYLVKASFSKGITGADHSTSYSYDFRGNLTSLRRKGVTDIQPNGNTVYGLLDGITASFSGFRPTELGVESEGEIFRSRTGMRKEGGFTMTYDFAGRLDSDESRGIESTTYDCDGLVRGLDLADGGRFTYERDGSGNLLSSTILVPTAKGESIVKFREYTGNGHVSMDDELQMTRFPGGYFTPDGGVFYYVTDYQGNVCNVVRALKENRPDLSVYQTMDYYPYGEPFREWDWDLAERSSALSPNRYLYNGNERETGLGVNQYDFNARTYVASYPFFTRPDSKCTEFPWLNPYTFCGGDPVNHTDPSGNVIRGITGEDTANVVQDLREIFHADSFTKFRDLIVPAGKDQNGLSLATISQSALADAFEGVALNEDQQALVEMTVNTINSKDIHFVEYVENTVSPSEYALDAFSSVFDNKDLADAKQAYGGQVLSWCVQGRGGGSTAPYRNGTYSLISINQSAHGVNRAITTGHEILGHGRSLALGRGDANQHYDAVQTENLVRRVFGFDIPHTGAGHDAIGTFPGHTNLPAFR